MAKIARHRGEYPLTLMCRVLSVSRSAFYSWRHRKASKRALEDDVLCASISATHAVTNQEYGTPRHRRELLDLGHGVSRRRIKRLMNESGCMVLTPRRWQVTTKSDPSLPVAPNLLNRNFHAERPNRVWVADLTYCWTSEGWLYLAAVLDLCSRRVVGWATSSSADHRVVVEAWRRAVALRNPEGGLIHHSDRGSTYASAAYKQELKERGALCSMSRKGDCWDNAVVESFFGTLERGLIHRRRWATRGMLNRALVDYIDGWYNRKRRHSTLGYVSPVRFEQQLLQAA